MLLLDKNAHGPWHISKLYDYGPSKLTSWLQTSPSSPYVPVCNVQIHWLHYSSKVSLFELTQRRWTLNHRHITGIKSSSGYYTIMMLFHPINTISTFIMDRTTSLSVIYHMCHGWMEHKWCIMMSYTNIPLQGYRISAFRSVFVGLLGARFHRSPPPS